MLTQKKANTTALFADYDKAIESKSDYAMALNNRGSAYAKKGQYDRAIADCDKAIDIQPDFVMALYNRNLHYAKKGEYDRAIADCDIGDRYSARFCDGA